MIFWRMSLLELKQAVDHLQPEERLELAEYVRWRAAQDDPVWQSEIGRRLDRSIAGKGHTRDELMSLHDRLSAEGK